MQKIDRAEYQQRLDQLSEILSGIADHAANLSTGRCPYKNRHNQCTAKFGCRNQRRSQLVPVTPVAAPTAAASPAATSPTALKILLCAGDDKLDYRSAWESGH